MIVDDDMTVYTVIIKYYLYGHDI